MMACVKEKKRREEKGREEKRREERRRSQFEFDFLCRYFSVW